MKFPALHVLDQNFKTVTNADAELAVAEELERSNLLGPVAAGQTVVITAGSRGVDAMTTVLHSLTGAVKARGAKPVILPAMGSHGGGTAKGQMAVLKHLGLTSETVGAPIHDRLEPIKIAEVEGSPVFADRAAIDADHIILVNRIKEHTEFIGEIESGLLKMAVVGLGRIAGAEVMHQLAVKISYARTIQAMARALFSNLPILGGIAILDDKTNKFRRLVAIPKDAVFERERELLQEARHYHAMLPFTQLDVLLVDEIGKEISGAGFDTKVIGRIRNIYEKECEQPKITRIVLRDLSEKTGGNAIGIGLADFVHRRVVEKMDPEITAINSITAVAPEKGMVPIALPSDRKTLEAAFQSIGPWNTDSVRMAWIINTAELTRLAVSAALAREAKLKGLSISERTFVLPFDGNGDLPGLRESLLAG
ncbi:MAG: hypothetical protein JSW26_26825 [Desulfobacterales bacterium]|nr:MAG: hypothetical protein JSW26_26825 [Desulfobacterales bacterium]